MCEGAPSIALLENAASWLNYLHGMNRPRLEIVLKKSTFIWVSYHALSKHPVKNPSKPLPHRPYQVIHSSRCDSIHSSAHTLVPHLTHFTFPQYPQIEQNTLTGYLISSSPHAPFA